jgi:lipopolysaccharide export system protein LptA
MRYLWLLIILVVTGVRAADEEKPPARPGLQINAEYAEIRLKENTAYYSNNVTIVDPPPKPGDLPTTIRCRELTATRSSDGKLDKIVALGAVQIDQGEMHARGHQAVYTATNEAMVLTGAFDGTHPLPYVYSAQGTNRAGQITYDRLQDKIFFRESVFTDVASSALSKTNQGAGGPTTKTNKTRAPGTLVPVPGKK